MGSDLITRSKIYSHFLIVRLPIHIDNKRGFANVKYSPDDTSIVLVRQNFATIYALEVCSIFLVLRSLSFEGDSFLVPFGVDFSFFSLSSFIISFTAFVKVQRIS